MVIILIDGLRGCLPNAQEWSNIFTPVRNDEGRVRQIILITLMLVGCQIGGCLDQADAQLVGEAWVQDQSNKRSGGDIDGQRPVRTACKTEIEKLCTGEPRAGRCLQNQNPEKLSEECKAALANRGSR